MTMPPLEIRELRVRAVRVPMVEPHRTAHSKGGADAIKLLEEATGRLKE